VSTVIRQQAASPSCHPSWQRMHSSDACAGRRTMRNTLIPMYECIHLQKLITTGRHMYPLKTALPVDPMVVGVPHASAPKRHLDRFSRFCTIHPHHSSNQQCVSAINKLRTVHIYFIPGRCAKYCDQHVCMSVHHTVCLSVHSHISTPHVKISPNCPYLLPVTVIRYPLMATQQVMNILFCRCHVSHNEAN